MFFRKSPQKLESKSDEMVTYIEEVISIREALLSDSKGYHKKITEEYEKAFNEAVSDADRIIVNQSHKQKIKLEMLAVETLPLKFKEFMGNYKKAKELYKSDEDIKRVEEKIERYENIGKDIL